MPAGTSGNRGNLFTPLDDVAVTNAATLLRAANDDRFALILTNHSDTVHIRIGDATVTATRGVRLYAGASMTVTATSSIYAISEGANVTVSRSEELAG